MAVAIALQKIVGILPAVGLLSITTDSNKSVCPLRCPALEHGSSDRLAPAFGVDRHGLRRKLKTDFRYSNTLGWNTFPVPKLTEKNKEDLTRCAEDILLAREAHFPATIADLYDPEKMPADLRAAHDRNDETLERIYIGRRFRNDTERLEKLFELYTKMTKKGAA